MCLRKIKQKLESISIVNFTAGTAPDFVKKPDNCTAPLKGDAKFEATLSGEPYPDVKWYVKLHLRYWVIITRCATESVGGSLKKCDISRCITTQSHVF